MITDWKDKRVTVMGLGAFGGGVGVTRWLAGAGARVTVSDAKTADELADSVAQLADIEVELHLGGHEQRDFADAELVVANPAVKPGAGPLRITRDAGVPITTEVNLFVERCPAACIAVTGSVGKSTITAMIGHILENAQSRRRVWVGGNIGRSLLDPLPNITPNDWAVLELSSFQLHWTPLVRWSPRVAVITTITPNHLDWHGDFASYVADKLNIARFGDPTRDTLIIEDTPGLRDEVAGVLGSLDGVWCYGLAENVPTARRHTSEPEGDAALRWPDVRLAIPGAHNRRNAAAALTAAAALGIEATDAAAALADFKGLPHRLCHVGTVDGVAYYDDSKSTTPEAAITALNAIDGPTLIIMGGYDKKSDLTPVVEIAARRSRYVACLGQTGPTLVAELKKRGAAAEMHNSLADAVTACARHAQPGDTVLLSPGCASWGMFRDYRARGEEFAECVRGLQG